MEIPDRTKEKKEINPKQSMSLRSQWNDLVNVELSSDFQIGLKVELYIYILIEQLGRVENLYIDWIWHVRYWRYEIIIFDCNFYYRITTKNSFHYRLRSLNSRDENIRFWFLNLYRVAINFDNQNHLLNFYPFCLLFNKTTRNVKLCNVFHFYRNGR